MPSTTLRAIRRALMGALNDGRAYRVASSTTTLLAVTALTDTTPNASVNRYDDRWVYVASGTAIGQVRFVQRGGFNPTTAILTLNAPWSPPSPLDEVELTGLFSSTTTAIHAGPGDATSYTTIINAGLARLLVPDRVTLPITTASSYSLSTYPWMDRPGRLGGIYEPGPVSGSRVVDCGWRGIRLVRAPGGGSALEVDAPFSLASGNLTLDVLRPAPSLVNGFESTVGLVSDADTVAVDLGSAVTVCLVEAYRSLLHRTYARPSGPWSDLYEHQLEEARRLRFWDSTLEVDAAQTPEAA